MSDERWSLVLTQFQGKWEPFHKAAPLIFGRKGLDVFSLVLGRDTLPAELMEGLDREQATQMAAACEALGARVNVVPTAQVGSGTGPPAVRFRASEVWPTHVTDHFVFTELDGMILAAPPVNARKNLAVLRRTSPDFANWQIERGVNHVHADASWTQLPPRERVRQESDLAHLYENDLRRLYPATDFVVSHVLGHSVSFYQRTQGAPTQNAAAPSRESPEEKVWCVQCDHQQPYRLRAETDTEFPEVEWGNCLVCGSEVLVASREVLRVIGPSAALR